MITNSGGHIAPIHGRFELPQVLGEDDALNEALDPVHLGVAIAIAVLSCCPSGPRSANEFVLRGDTLRRMRSFRRVRAVRRSDARAEGPSDG